MSIIRSWCRYIDIKRLHYGFIGLTEVKHHFVMSKTVTDVGLIPPTDPTLVTTAFQKTKYLTPKLATTKSNLAAV